jgi:hypothetical protein
VAIGVNLPFGWFIRSYGVSVYVGLHRHFALRANVARYNAESLPTLAVALMAGDGGGPAGRIDDYGIGAIWFPRRLWDGPMIEVGALLRNRDTVDHPDFDDRIETQSTTFAGRATVGWSWLLQTRAFISFAVGFSAGQESGRETITPDEPFSMTTTRDVKRDRGSGEAYFRFGFTFGG